MSQSPPDALQARVQANMTAVQVPPENQHYLLPGDPLGSRTCSTCFALKATLQDVSFSKEITATRLWAAEKIISRVEAHNSLLTTGQAFDAHVIASLRNDVASRDEELRHCAMGKEDLALALQQLRIESLALRERVQSLQQYAAYWKTVAEQKEEQIKQFTRLPFPVFHE